MLRYIVWRIAVMVPTLLVISMLVFTIIQLPPGDFFESQIAELQAQGETANLQEIQELRKEYGLDKPVAVQYVYWVAGMLHGNFGYSFEYQLPVSQVVGDRLWLTILVSFTTILLTWLIAFPIGIYSATHQYSWSDYSLTFLGLLGIAIPNFMLALILMYFANVWFGVSIGHLMDQKYLSQPMSWEKASSILSHLWIPVVIVGTAGTAGMIRRLRANLLDEMQKQYVITARAKGLHPLRALIKYPLRMALNFFVADIGSILPSIISGAEITAIVLSLETTGPMLIKALQSQDMYLAGSFLMFLAVLNVIGVLISDIALGFLDPVSACRAGASVDLILARTRGADAALRLDSAIRPDAVRGDVGRPDALSHGVAKAAYVVEIQAPPGGCRLRHIPAFPLRRRYHRRVHCALRPTHTQCRLHPCTAPGGPHLP